MVIYTKGKEAFPGTRFKVDKMPPDSLGEELRSALEEKESELI